MLIRSGGTQLADSEATAASKTKKKTTEKNPKQTKKLNLTITLVNSWLVFLISLSGLYETPRFGNQNEELRNSLLSFHLPNPWILT